MKKGFLRGQQLTTADNSVEQIKPRPEGIKIPSEPVEHGDDDEGSDTLDISRALGKDMMWATLPPYDPTRPNEPLTECLIGSEIKAQILATPGFPRPFRTPEPPRYKIKPVRGAGIGMFATVDIDIGEVIVVERPLVISLIALFSIGSLSAQQPAELQRLLVERLSRKEYEEYYALSNCKGYTRAEVTGIMDTNGIGIGTLPGGANRQAGAVCRAISRVNHSCCNNATWEFQLESFSVELRAILPIKKGEQVFVSYGSKNENRSQRQKYLLERYKFTCACFACTSPQSDEMRAAARHASRANDCTDDSALLRWVSDRKQPDDLIIAECFMMISLLDDQKYCNAEVWPVWYQRLVKAFCALEDEENARKWAVKAAKLTRAFILHDGGWDAVAKDPKKTNWWGLRSKTRSGVRLVTDFEDFKSRRMILGKSSMIPGRILPLFTR